MGYRKPVSQPQREVNGIPKTVIAIPREEFSPIEEDGQFRLEQ